MSLLVVALNAKALSPNEMLVVIGVVKYYNENCAGLSYEGVKRMNKGLKRFDMDNTPVAFLERNTLAITGYEVAEKYGCAGTKQAAFKSGYGQYIN